MAVDVVASMMMVDFASVPLVVVDRDWLEVSDIVAVIFVCFPHLYCYQSRVILITPIEFALSAVDYVPMNDMPLFEHEVIVFDSDSDAAALMLHEVQVIVNI